MHAKWQYNKNDLQLNSYYWKKWNKQIATTCTLNYNNTDTDINAIFQDISRYKSLLHSKHDGYKCEVKWMTFIINFFSS